MKSITIRQAGYVLACIFGSVFMLSACSSSSSDSGTAPQTVAISGKVISQASPAGEQGVQVKGFYSDSDPANPSTSTAADGTYSLTVEANKAVSVQMSKAGFATFNFQKVALTANITDGDEEMVDQDLVQAVIDAALGGSTTLIQNKAWFVVTVTNANDNEIAGVSITASPAPDIEVYTECDGTESPGDFTTANCNPGREGVQYIAYYDAAPGDITVTAIGQTQVVPVRMGEISVLDFEQPGIISISGTISSSVNPAGESGVTVRGFYTNTSLGTPTTTTAVDGSFSLSILENTPVSVQVSKSGLLTLNSARETFAASASGFDIDVPTTAEGAVVIDTAYSGQTLASGAWLAVNVEDGSGTEIDGVTITTSQTNIIAEAALECDGTVSTGVVTIANCNPAREGPMYLAYFSADTEITVTVGGVTQTAPVRIGEVTFIDFVQ